MKEFIFVGIAIMAAIGAFVLINKKTQSDCVP